MLTRSYLGIDWQQLQLHTPTSNGAGGCRTQDRSVPRHFGPLRHFGPALAYKARDTSVLCRKRNYNVWLL